MHLLNSEFGRIILDNPDGITGRVENGSTKRLLEKAKKE
jgi:hypothetical protein